MFWQFRRSIMKSIQLSFLLLSLLFSSSHQVNLGLVHILTCIELKKKLVHLVVYVTFPNIHNFKAILLFQ